MREERGSRLRRGSRRGDCRVCHRRDGAMRHCPCRVSAGRRGRGFAAAEAGAPVGSALDCTVVLLAPPLDPAGSIRGHVLSDHEVTMLGDRARRRDATPCIASRVACRDEGRDEPPPYIESRESRDRVTEPRHRAARKRVLGCVPTTCRYGRRPRPASRVEITCSQACAEGTRSAGRTEGSGTMREERGSRLRRGGRRGACRVCHRRDGAMRRCPCRVSARRHGRGFAPRTQQRPGARGT